MPSKCAVVGNPVAHSLSPQIHQHFANQFGLSLSYSKIQAKEEALDDSINDFFRDGGVGLNITIPFKTMAFDLCDQVTPTAEKCKAVNTLWVDRSGALLGDSTDGSGLINDLLQKRAVIDSCKVLILGAGGAAQSIVPALVERNARIALVNRTKEKAQRIASEFDENVTLMKSSDGKEFDIVINTMAIDGERWLQSLGFYTLSNTFVYDISYGERAATFLNACREMGASNIFDGWGMLVEQAALSFNIWHGKMPDTTELIKHPLY